MGLSGARGGVLSLPTAVLRLLLALLLVGTGSVSSLEGLRGGGAGGPAAFCGAPQLGTRPRQGPDQLPLGGLTMLGGRGRAALGIGAGASPWAKPHCREGGTAVLGTKRQRIAGVKRAVKTSGKARRWHQPKRPDESWKEKSLFELIEDWPLGLGSRKTASQRQREDERSWDWMRFMFWRVKVHKQAIPFFQVAKLLILYIGFSAICAAIHVLVVVVALCASLQIFMEHEYEQNMSQEERLLLETLPFLDEDDNPEEYGYYE